MSAMRYAAFFVVALSFLIPSSASAAFVPLVSNKGCTAASAGNPTGEKSFSFASGAEEVKAYLDSKVACPSACFHETVTLEVGALGIKTDIRGINACTRTEKDPNAEDAVKDKRGCGKGLTPPTVTVKVTGLVQKQYPAKSRCDAENIAAAIDAVSKGDLNGAQAALERLAESPDLPPELRGAVSGNQSLINAFVQTGVTAQEAERIIQSDPAAAVDYIQAIAQNNPGAISASAARLNLNPMITAAQQQAVLRAVQQSVPQQQAPAQQAPNAASTFADGAVSDIVKAKCAIASIESGSCQGNHYLRGPITRRGDRAYGKYQVMGANVPSWTMRSCGRAYSPEAFLRDPQCQEKVFETIFSEHVRSCGSYEGAASKWFSGRCQITNSNDGYTSVSTYVRELHNAVRLGCKPAVFWTESVFAGKSIRRDTGPEHHL
ncbi:MAG: Phage-related minor tail protein [Parcubacteria group bacterium Athens0416_74]|nr:MAG: Phage-related minor tail protein [Parcubacteria group bacterium Athens0416_74]